MFSGDGRERSRKQPFCLVSAEPFAEFREDYQLPDAIKIQMLRNCGNSSHELADPRERSLNLACLEMYGGQAQKPLASADDEPSASHMFYRQRQNRRKTLRPNNAKELTA